MKTDLNLPINQNKNAPNGPAGFKGRRGVQRIRCVISDDAGTCCAEFELSVYAWLADGLQLLRAL